MKTIVRLVLDYISLICAYVLRVVARYTSFIEVSQFISTIPFHFGKTLRNRFYRLTLLSCGADVVFHYGAILTYKEINIGNNVHIGPFNTLGHVNIGDNVLTAQYCHFLSGANQHGFDRTDIPICMQEGKSRTITIGSDVWVGANAVVMNDVGNGCVVAAGAVVVKPVEQYLVVGGNSARVLKKR